MNIFTDNPDFYPTPREVIDRMLMGEDIAGKTILEPSAGKGDICEVLREYGCNNILVCENDEHNKKLLQGKYDEFMCDDFLQLTSERVSHVNLIVMNPPFSNGCEHINHAFEIAPPGCTIIALCNNSNFHYCHSRPKSMEYRVDELIKDYGHRESLGHCFNTAERKTDVNVVLIKLYKEGEGANEFDGYMFEGFDSDSLNGNQSEGLVTYNFVRDLVNRYTGAVKLFDETMEAAKRINEMARYNDPDDEGKPSYLQAHIPIVFKAVKRNEDSRYSDTPVTHALYKKELKRYYWGIIFRKLNMEKYATKELREQINKFIETQGTVPFTMKNIYKVVDMVIQTNGQRMQRALVEVFDKVCSLSAQNSTAGEKWKTNSNYMVNKRFIVNYIGKPQDSRWPDKYVNISYGGNTDVINDLIKALCWLTATNYDDISSLDSYCRQNKPDWGEWFECGFFKVRVYKKGTAHFEFLDENIWARFNQEVAKTKGWSLGSQEQKTKKPRKPKTTTVPDDASVGPSATVPEASASASTPTATVPDASPSDSSEANQLSPMLKHFLELKTKHPEALLLFRCGDFYETYMQDAEKAARILGITLTRSTKQKDPDGKPLAMAGFPYHALDTYLPKLIRAGEKVTICDQLDAPTPKATVTVKPATQPATVPSESSEGKVTELEFEF